MVEDAEIAPARIILVEDDEDLQHGMAEFLLLSGFTVTSVGTGIGFYRALQADAFDVAILDVNLPDVSGFELARELAVDGRMGIILMTARASAEDRLRGYFEGADVYLTKPVAGEELILATTNLVRRIRSGRAPVSPQDASEVPAWRLDKANHALTSPTGEVIVLSGREMLVMEAVAQADGKTLLRRDLTTALGYADDSPESRSLDALLGRLRRKVRASGSPRLPLHPLRSVGFTFSEAIRVI